MDNPHSLAFCFTISLMMVGRAVILGIKIHQNDGFANSKTIKMMAHMKSIKVVGN